MVAVTTKTRTISNGTANDAVPVEQTFVELYANDNTLATAVTALEVAQVPLSALIGFNATAAPKYLTATTISVARVACMSASGTSIMRNAGPLTVDLASVGISGLAQSTNLAGQVSVTAAGTTVSGTGTAFLTDYVVGDVIRTAGGQGRTITAITNNTALTVGTAWTSTESLVTYRRGGRASNTWYHLYAISNGTLTNLIFSQRNVAGGQVLTDLPSGYTSSRQLSFSVLTDASSNFKPFYVAEGWPERPKILYEIDGNASGGASSSTAFATAVTSNQVPQTSRIALIDFGLRTTNTGVGNTAFYRTAGSSDPTGRSLGVAANIIGVTHRLQANIAVNASAQFEVRVQDATTILDWVVVGYIVTEVA
jgi:hypothetical protein